MPQPTQSAVHVNRPLTMLSVAYAQAQSAFIADKVFPVVPVDKQSDLYYVYTKNDWFRDEAQVRPPATERGQAARRRHRVGGRRLRPVDLELQVRRVRVPQGHSRPGARERGRAAE